MRDGGGVSAPVRRTAFLICAAAHLVPRAAAFAGVGETFDAKAGRGSLTAGDLWLAARGAGSGRTADIDAPLAAVAYGWRFAGASLSERSRIERLDGDPWRHRNRLLVERPVAGIGPVGSVFASDEVFYDFGRNRWSRNRAPIGLGLLISKRGQVQVYYLRQDDRYARPGTLHALGLACKVDFR